MRTAILIWRKDLRRFWWEVGTTALLAVAYAACDIAVVHNRGWEGIEPLLGIALGLRGFLLTVALIHEDRLVGDRQFWLTRPMSGKSLLLAKLLFLMTGVLLPLAVMQMVAVVANGLPLVHYIPAILARQVLYLSVLVVLAAVASVTTNLVQAAVGIPALYLFVAVLGMVLSRWMSFDGARPGVPVLQSVWALYVAVAVTACLWQSARRSIWGPRALLATGAITAMFLIESLPWPASRSLFLAGWPAVDASVAQISLAPDFGIPPGPSRYTMAIPLRITGIPPGQQVYSNRVQIELRGPGGERWSDADRAIQIEDVSKQPPISHCLAAGGGAYWLEMPSAPLNLIGKAAHLRLTVDFTLLGKPNTARLASTRGSQSTDDGFCEQVPLPGSKIMVACKEAFKGKGEDVIRIEDLLSGAVQEKGSAEDLASSQASVFSIWQSYPVAWFEIRPGVKYQLEFETREVVAHFERVLDVPDFVLGATR